MTMITKKSIRDSFRSTKQAKQAEIAALKEQLAAVRAELRTIRAEEKGALAAVPTKTKTQVAPAVDIDSVKVEQTAVILYRYDDILAEEMEKRKDQGLTSAMLIEACKATDERAKKFGYDPEAATQRYKEWRATEGSEIVTSIRAALDEEIPEDLQLAAQKYEQLHGIAPSCYDLRKELTLNSGFAFSVAMDGTLNDMLAGKFKPEIADVEDAEFTEVVESVSAVQKYQADIASLGGL